MRMHINRIDNENSFGLVSRFILLVFGVTIIRKAYIPLYIHIIYLVSRMQNKTQTQINSNQNQKIFSLKDIIENDELVKQLKKEFGYFRCKRNILNGDGSIGFIMIDDSEQVLLITLAVDYVSICSLYYEHSECRVFRYDEAMDLKVVKVENGILSVLQPW